MRRWRPGGRTGWGPRRSLAPDARAGRDVAPGGASVSRGPHPVLPPRATPTLPSHPLDDRREAGHLQSLLVQRLDRLEAALLGHDWLVGDRYSIADLSVAPRVQMYPAVQLPLEPARHPQVCDWLARLAAQLSFVRSESIQPA